MTFDIMPQVNPYIAGNPVTGNQFFGRDDILAQVERILASPGQNALIVFGQRRIGKTSLLLQLQQTLPSEQYKVIYQDLQDRARYSMGTLLTELAGEIAYELDLEATNLPFDDHGVVFQKEFLPTVYQTLPYQDHRLVLLFDEFDMLNGAQRELLADDAAANQLFPTLRRLLREEPRLIFIFALGRNLYDLNSDFLSTFKSSQTVHISVFSEESARRLITAPESLIYTTEAIRQIYRATSGHPHLTQLLCSLCFDQVSERTTQYPAQVTAADVKTLIPLLLSRGDNVFAWIWDGLPTAERIIASTLAELLTDDEAVATQEEIEAVLKKEGIRVVTRDLEVSPEKLVKWGLLRRVDDGYQFLVSAIHWWIKQNKPVAYVQDERDKLNPRAHRYYELAKLDYENDDLISAKYHLQGALNLNLDHLQARILLGDIELEQGDLPRAIEAYSYAYKHDKRDTKAKLMQALMQKAKRLEEFNPIDAFETYQELIEIDPDDPHIHENLEQLKPSLDKFKRRLKRSEFIRIVVNGFFLGLLPFIVFSVGLDTISSAQFAQSTFLRQQFLFIPFLWAIVGFISTLVVMIFYRQNYKNEPYTLGETFYTYAFGSTIGFVSALMSFIAMGISWRVFGSIFLSRLIAVFGAGIVMSLYLFTWFYKSPTFFDFERQKILQTRNQRPN